MPVANYDNGGPQAHSAAGPVRGTAGDHVQAGEGAGTAPSQEEAEGETPGGKVSKPKTH